MTTETDNWYRNQIKSCMNEMRATCESLEEIEQFIQSHWEVFWWNGLLVSPMMITGNRFDLPVVPLRSVKFTASMFVSLPGLIGPSGKVNSVHQVQGIIEFSLADYIPFFANSFFHNTGLNLTSGGGSSTLVRYGFFLLESEWPKYQTALEMGRVASKLAMS